MQAELQRVRLALHGQGTGDGFTPPAQRDNVIRAGKHLSKPFACERLEVAATTRLCNAYCVLRHRESSLKHFRERLTLNIMHHPDPDKELCRGRPSPKS